MIQMKRVQKVNRAYTYEKVKSSDIMKLLMLFNAKNIFVEIINIRTDSCFCKNIQNRKIEHVLHSNSSSTYTDVIISECFDENFTDILNEIIDSDPETLLFYLTDLSLENFLYCIRNIANDQIIAKRAAACIFEIIFEENTFLLSFNAELFRCSDFIPKIDNIFIN